MHPKAEVQTDQCTPGFDGIHAGGDLAGTLTFLDQRAEQVLDRAPDCSHEALDLVVVGRQFDRGSDDEAAVLDRSRANTPPIAAAGDDSRSTTARSAPP